MHEASSWIASAGNDAALRARVEQLLASHDAAGSFLQCAPLTDGSPGTQLPRDMPRREIGPYTLLEPIGEGGFGVVYLAEQHRPIQRKVALKLLRVGGVGSQVFARFDAERQALALMDHPNIAVVHDAGVTEAGDPYFVMEYVHGLPITKFADDQRLSLEERLHLFIQLCDAVQHAHQKGVIHRDLKPSNVLVSLVDGRPLVKVIDFGVAKALGARLTAETLHTQHGVDDLAQVLALDGAIEKLRGLDARAADVVRLRFYGGLSVDETAEALGVAARTVRRDWTFARAWLFQALGDSTAA